MIATWPRAVRWRLTFWYAAALALALAVFALASLLVLRQSLERRSDRFLIEARNVFVAELAVEAREFPNTSDAIRAAIDEVRFDETRFFVFDEHGRRLAATDTTVPVSARVAERPERAVDEGRLRALASPDSAASRPSGAVVLRSFPDSLGGYRVTISDLAIHGRRHTVAAAHSRHGIRDTLRLVAAAYAVAIPIILSLAAGFGYALARRALAPVTTMSQRAREISASTLHDRLPVANEYDELGELASVINELLARLDDAFAQQRRFVADASHELRTPVAILRAEGDVALGRPTRSEVEYRDAITVMRDAGDRLSRIVDDLFLLARTDAGHQPVRREALYFDELTADSVRAMRAVAEQLGVRLVLESEIRREEGAPLSGDPALLHRLVTNLVDNAVKYSRTGGTVHVHLGRDQGHYVLTVTDNGPGIPLAAQPHIFERFFRADPSRSRADPASPDTLSRVARVNGAGLGLAIAQWVALAHGGTLALTNSSPEGSEFTATLPAESDGSRAGLSP
jgi:heavy metal sensor kinase